MPSAPYRWVDEPRTTPLEPGAVLVTSFPGQGLAATVAAHYMVRTLALPRIAVLDSTDAIPIAVVQGGHVSPPLRVYGKGKFGLVMSEFPPTPSNAVPIAQAILQAAEARRCRLVVCLEGAVPHPVEEEGEGSASVTETIWVVLSQPDAAVMTGFRAAGARQLEDGVLGGISGAMLVGGLHSSIPVATLLVSASGPEGFPDHRAGAALIEMLDRYLPELAIDTKPLRSQAEVIERALRAAMRTQGKPVEAPNDGPKSPSMYQ
jgi:predicted ATP-grasp superfamily ATP-dependent carboligase